jgi:hypothetical protein
MRLDGSCRNGIDPYSGYEVTHRKPTQSAASMSVAQAGFLSEQDGNCSRKETPHVIRLNMNLQFTFSLHKPVKYPGLSRHSTKLEEKP